MRVLSASGGACTRRRPQALSVCAQLASGSGTNGSLEGVAVEGAGGAAVRAVALAPGDAGHDGERPLLREPLRTRRTFGFAQTLSTLPASPGVVRATVPGACCATVHSPFGNGEPGSLQRKSDRESAIRSIKCL